MDSVSEVWDLAACILLLHFYSSHYTSKLNIPKSPVSSCRSPLLPVDTFFLVQVQPSRNLSCGNCFVPSNIFLQKLD